MTALSGNLQKNVLMVANTGPNAGTWQMHLPQRNGTMKNLIDGSIIEIKDGRFSLNLPGYGYAIWSMQ